MAVLTFPLGLSSFWTLLPISRETVEPSRAQEVSRTRGGEILTAELGASLWAGKIELGPMPHAEVRALTPLINLLSRPGASFLVAHSARMRPLLDPTGAILGAATPSVLAVGASARELSLTGLPAGYALSAGDLVGFTYGGRSGLHELVSAVTANGAGQTALFEVTPPIRPGLTAGTAVQLSSPRCKAVIDPGSVALGAASNTITSGVSFAWTQTLRI